MFAAVDGTGRLDLWNLNKDTEVASASVVVEGGAALNRVTWTQSGLHVAAGDDQGKIWVYDVGEQLAVPQPDEWNKFAHTLQVNIVLGFHYSFSWNIMMLKRYGKLKNLPMIQSQWFCFRI